MDETLRKITVEGKPPQVRGQISTLDPGATARYCGNARGRAVGHDVGFESQAIAVSTTGGRENVAPVCVSAIAVSLRGGGARFSSVGTALDSVFPQKLRQIAAVFAG
jgi:hypothetical protein